MSRIVRAKESLRHLNAFVSVSSIPEAGSTPEGKLAGLAIAVKDNICTQDLPTTCGSHGLNHFTSPYDATVVAELRRAGATIVGKTNLDEFGMGSHSLHSAFGAVQNMIPGLSAGGSSGGSAVAVATNQCDAALGTDTGGSVRLPAAFNSVFGFKPSYGLFSRWGVVAYANSLDTVGIMVGDVNDLNTIFKTLSTHDVLDPTSTKQKLRAHRRNLICERERARQQARPKGKLNIGIPMEYNIEGLSPSVKQAWQRAMTHFRKLGHKLISVSLPTTQSALSCYYVLAPAEASSNLSKYDGARYGASSVSNLDQLSQRPASQVHDQNEIPDAAHTSIDMAAKRPLYASTRHSFFSPEVRRRILLGTYTLSSTAMDNYFLRAQRVRRLIQDDFDSVFMLPNLLRTSVPEPRPYCEAMYGAEEDEQSDPRKVDILLTPTAPALPPTLESLKNQSPVQAYATDVFTVPASLAGLPAISVPVNIDRELARAEYADQMLQLGAGFEAPTTAGIQIIGQNGDDSLVLRAAAILSDTCHDQSISSGRLE